jgi:DNA-binding SARP family transcriptional activator
VQVRLLGPVEVVVDGQARPLAGLRRKAVLAVLALYRGAIVGTDRLVDVVWGEHAPPTVGNTLQRHISYLRQVLGDRAVILARPPGYVLDLGPDGTDVQVAERLIRRARQATDGPERVRQLQAALDLWRGRSLADVTELPWLEEQAHQLEQLWREAKRGLIDARLALGEHAALATEIEWLAAEYPLDEQFHGQWILALYRTGRQAEALAAYDRLRRALDEELGIVPGQPLRDLYASILRQDPVLDPAPPPVQVRDSPVPAQLPPAVPSFAGRERELAELDAVRSGIAVLSGTAGVGKTALAVHWAHRVTDLFPDGQLYVNLRGFDPGGSVTGSAEAVRGFLDALGVPPEKIPPGLDAQAARYRSLMADRRMLVLLDNARDAEQVRPLLPGAPGCLVLVTSRNQLASLVAVEGARPLTLDRPDAEDCRRMLSNRVGADRVAAEPDAVAGIVVGCDRLPLALAVVAARAAAYPQFRLATLAAELGGGVSSDRLDALAAGDAATDVRAVFSWSYQALSAGAARLFRLLGLHGGPDVSAAAAASVAGVPPREVRPLLAELAQAHLIVEHVPNRYTFHDLLRAYALEQFEPDAEREAAAGRALDHYLHAAFDAALVLNPHRQAIALAGPRPGVTPEHLTDRREALAWFAAEHRILLAAVDRAARTGLDPQVWQLAWTLTTYLNRQGHWADWAATWQAAVDAARRLADPTLAAPAHRGVAWAYLRQGRHGEAGTELKVALDWYQRLGDLVGQADTRLDLGWACTVEDRHHEALEHAREALDLYRAAGHRAGQAVALNNIGMAYAELGEYRAGLVASEQALVLHQQIGDPDQEAGAWDSVGYAHHHLGDHARATTCYRKAIDLYRELGDRYEEAKTLTHLGDTHRAAGDSGAARDAWQEALAILVDLDHADADQVRARLGEREERAERAPQPRAKG